MDILAIGVHPDDVELSCGGTILKHIDLGYTVGILDLTQGELGTRGNAKIRLAEARAAADYAGIGIRENLNLGDGFFENDKESKLRIVEVIRKHKPRIVLANAIKDRHPDHGRAAKLIHDACFIAGLSKVPSQLDGKAQAPHRPKRILHYVQDQVLEPDVVIDITGYMERKMEFIQCYTSQFFDPNSTEKSTPISSQSFMDYIRARERVTGRQIGVEYAEAYTTHHHIGIHELNHLI